VARRASRARRFDILDQPFVVRQQPGEHKGAFLARRDQVRLAHEERMMALLYERYGIAARDPERTVKLMNGVVRDYVAAFRIDHGQGVGRPRSGITDREVRAIERDLVKQREKGRKQSVIAACRKVVAADKAAAKAAAYRRYQRTTK